MIVRLRHIGLSISARSSNSKCKINEPLFTFSSRGWLLQEPGSFFPGRDVLIFRPLLDGVPQDSKRDAPQLPGPREELFDYP